MEIYIQQSFGSLDFYSSPAIWNVLRRLLIFCIRIFFAFSVKPHIFHAVIYSTLRDLRDTFQWHLLLFLKKKKNQRRDLWWHFVALRERGKGAILVYYSSTFFLRNAERWTEKNWFQVGPDAALNWFIKEVGDLFASFFFFYVSRRFFFLSFLFEACHELPRNRRPPTWIQLTFFFSVVVVKSLNGTIVPLKKKIESSFALRLFDLFQGRPQDILPLIFLHTTE